MKYRLLYTNRAVKDIKKLDNIIKDRISKTLLRFADNPLEYSEPLSNIEIGTYRFRIGDYRVIFDIEGNNIVILRIGHRKEIYRKLRI
ncbi:MAG: type II toxin-antitoxin system RelE/ParE family toxin [Elusimicrobia bacterium]|nr:type II toxin-antitoxin system RelE/ParE family toxin [Elusimicrobiota bacterium]